MQISLSEFVLSYCFTLFSLVGSQFSTCLWNLVTSIHPAGRCYRPIRDAQDMATFLLGFDNHCNCIDDEKRNCIHLVDYRKGRSKEKAVLFSSFELLCRVRT
ncbi:unnamed protein product [Amoebophrya sp. A25]|nr:unnamed protein product [Amoebophrya sp. A25]CAD7976212.1 unnamed protein product [Amoebophrya sp. A25]|eukprot:GSA25T00016269001.1